MNVQDWGALIAICIAGALSPGPSLLVIISIATRYGQKAGLLSAAGHGTAVFIYAILTALSVSWLSSATAQLFFYIQISGALLLLWMGLSMLFLAGKQTLNSKNHDPKQNLGFAFKDGFLIGILNPKIAAFFASLFSQFVIPSQSFSVSFMMASIAGFVDITAYCIAALVANTLLVKQLFLNYGRVRDFIFGILLLLLSLSVIYESLTTLI